MRRDTVSALADAPGDSPPVALITGASSGIGEATAVDLAAAGYRVALTARRAERLETVRDRIDRDRALSLAADVTDRAALQRVVDAALERWGRIDVLVNNAGVMPLSRLEKVQVEDWARTVDVNVKGALHAIGAVLPVLLRQGSGHIVNLSSLASRRPFPTGVVYSATKFALRCISDGIRLELSASKGIRVTDVEPGVVRTELLDKVDDADARSSFVDHWEDRRALSAEDVARAVLFAVQSPPHVNVNEILLRPTVQAT